MRLSLPRIQGKIDYNHISFQYLQDREYYMMSICISSRVKQLPSSAVQARGKAPWWRWSTGFYEVSKGSLTIDGYDVRKVTQDSLRKQIGVVLQDPFLFSGTIKEKYCLRALGL